MGQSMNESLVLLPIIDIILFVRVELAARFSRPCALKRAGAKPSWI